MRTPLALLVLCGCSLVTEPDAVVPINPVAFDPPAVYAEWAGQLAACAGDPMLGAALMARVRRWYVTDGFEDNRDAIRLSVGGGYIGARSVPEDGRWVVYILRAHAGDAWVVRHELNHVRLDGDAGHVDSSWVCADRAARAD